MTIVDLKARARRYRRHALLVLGASLLLGFFAVLDPFALTHAVRALLAGLGIVALLACLPPALAYWKHHRQIRGYGHTEDQIAAIMASESSHDIRLRLEAAVASSGRYPVARELVEQARPGIASHLEAVLLKEEEERDKAARDARLRRLDAAFGTAQTLSTASIEHQRQNSPAVRADRLIADGAAKLRKLKADLQARWEEKDRQLSWWGKLNHEPLDTSTLDRKLEELEKAGRRLKSSGDLERTRGFFDQKGARTQRRLDASRLAALRTVPMSHREAYDEERIARNSLFLAAMSVPVSAWNDVTQAGEVYDALREVNKTYAHMSDFEIWLHTLMLPGESLAGLASLAKGSYFERLVEADSGGERFEHFNHPDTDIVIDGVAYQLKATDSASYIETVDADILVIATSEVALATGAIDSGYSDAELEASVDLALGGSIADASDTAVDAVLTSIGGVGLLSILKGIQRGSASYQADGDLEGAVINGVEAAAVGTAKAFVDTAELGYKVATSGPSRFIGRLVLKGLTGAVNAIDRQIEQK
ncbi:hypothetical protein [Teichococcus oryzae]|uniref:Uncharacterized protein n=1 Tax=Teichococcus oryzae TaxID=1608942 RepID=A0A5B2TBC7_9PROT|nr:hypothetical protein [Pseudoroseomonas oryzae]KAA2211364.1 hypothetical protein F0Q34_20485 [Pseudoroseomonas oryzae]